MEIESIIPKVRRRPHNSTTRLTFFDIGIVKNLKPVYLVTKIDRYNRIEREVEFTDYLTKSKVKLNHDKFIGNLLNEAFTRKSLFANYCYFFVSGRDGLEYLDYFYKYFLGEYEMTMREFFFVYKKFKETIYDAREFNILEIGDGLKKYFNSLTHNEKYREVYRFLTAELVVRSIALREVNEFDF